MPDIESNRCKIIAEIGVNHNGCLSTAKELVSRAHEAGADFVKFQIFSSDGLVSPSAEMASYQIENLGSKKSQLSMLKQLELSCDELTELKQHCDQIGICFSASVFDIEGLRMLESFSPNFIKLGSGELTNSFLLAQVARCGVPVILSTGMATLDEVKKSVDYLIDKGTSKDNLTLLHCVSDYPAQLSDLNLKCLQLLRETFDVAVGFSDHSLGYSASLAAVALGAQVIEKHVTLDVDSHGPDHAASIHIDSFAELISMIRDVELALGRCAKEPTTNELKTSGLVRRSLFAATDIKAGQIIKDKNISILRPADGLDPMLYDSVLGSKAIKDFATGEPLKLLDL